MIEIERASDCVNDIRSQMTELFIEGFWHLLQLLSKDRNGRICRIDKIFSAS